MSGSLWRWRTKIQWSGMVCGPVLALLVYSLLPRAYDGPGGTVVAFSAAGRQTLAVMVWMAIWWVTEAVDISVTALLPLVVFPVLGIRSMNDTAFPYADPMIFLFMGGFLIALAMQQWRLDRRVALLTLRIAGTRPSQMVAGFMVTTAALSAFVSNTATAAMMVPIALSVIQVVRHELTGARGSVCAGSKHLATCLLLGIAYASSLGGIATIIGTPPNSLLVAFVRSTIAEPYRTTITFDHWLLIGLPVTLLFLPITWFLLTRLLFRLDDSPIEGGRELIGRELAALGRVSRGEWATGVVFVVTACVWILRPLLVSLNWSWEGTTIKPLAGLSDPGIAMAGAIALFVWPIDASRRIFALDWSVAQKLPWGILLLFGGGLSLAAAVKANGVAEFIGSWSQYFAGMPPLVIVLAVTTIVIFLTELTSNSATTAALLPVLAALAPGMGIHPYLLILPATLAASCAFMMPVATPPNAIVFGSGEVNIADMARTGLWLNLVGIVLITALTMWWFPRLFP